MSMDHPVSALWSGMDQQLYGLNCGAYRIVFTQLQMLD